MPTWSWKEIKNCRKKLYTDRVPLELAKDLFSKWEGIPRYILERVMMKITKKKLNDIIKDYDMNIFNYIGEDCIKRSKLSHMIIHIDVNLPVKNDNKN
ncbi:hypothetical protein C1645_37646 [Glomus cerebriforme]|uniref:Uncharacterized protein n=1 Tax=Glomus cerebriforme TaxID=658196 RepID=A0A397T4E9_9GLOM|nr:hypothetical protein C1645_37646 [Glomus cerebriforme]